MSKAESTQATARYTVRRAKELPGHILGIAGTIIPCRGDGVWRDNPLLPPPRSEHPIFRIKHQWVDFPVLEEPVWVEGTRVRVDLWITKNGPNVAKHSGSCRNEVSSVYVVPGDFTRKADRERWAPPEEFLHHSVDVRQISFVRKLWEAIADNSIEFLVCFPHRLGVENHY
jgi:hypothetical protein